MQRLLLFVKFLAALFCSLSPRRQALMVIPVPKSKLYGHLYITGIPHVFRLTKCALPVFGFFLFLSSCSSNKMVTSSVAYQSIRTTFRQPDLSATNKPENAKIILAYTITRDGHLVVGIENNTREIMTIDQTMSFFINNGRSISYYDPTVKTQTITEIASSTEGASVNLGAIGSALGVGGRIGTALQGINLGSSGTIGTSTQNTTIIADQPRISIGPKGNCALSKTFQIDGIGRNALQNSGYAANIYNQNNSYCTFSVCISYSLDGGNTFEKITTDFYANSKIVLPVARTGMVNETLRDLLTSKTDALNENLWLLYFNTNVPGAYNSLVNGFLYDYQ